MTKDEIDQRMSEMDKRLISEEMTDKETLLVSLFEKKVGGKIIDGFFRKFFLANVEEIMDVYNINSIPKAIDLFIKEEQLGFIGRRRNDRG